MKKCKMCKKPADQWLIPPRNSMQKVCSIACALDEVDGKKAVQVEKKRKEQKRQDRKALEAMKNKPQLTKEAQQEFNRWVRLRDHGRACISCGRTPDDSNLITGSKYDAGHYRAVGAMPSLRFEPLNCWRQCVYCNRNLSGNVVEYRFGLIDRIGLEKLEWLEGEHPPKNYTRDDLRAIRDKYRQLANELKKQIDLSKTLQ